MLLKRQQIRNKNRIETRKQGEHKPRNSGNRTNYEKKC